MGRVGLLLGVLWVGKVFVGGWVGALVDRHVMGGKVFWWMGAVLGG